MIARIWRGAVAQGDGDAYARYLEQTGVAAYAATDGNLAVYMLRRDLPERTEFTMFTLWDSMDAVERFAGDQPDRAVFYHEDDRYLIERDVLVTHHEVALHVAPPPDRP